MDTIALIYESQQVRSLVGYYAALSHTEKEGFRVVALGADIELLLEEEGIPFTSGRTLRRLPHFECLTTAEAYAKKILDQPNFSFFIYRNISLVPVFITVLQEYLLYLFYFLDIFTSFAEEYPACKKLLLFAHTYVPLETDGVLAAYEATAAVTAARLVEKTYGFSVIIPPFETKRSIARTKLEAGFFYLQRNIFGLALNILNAVVTVCVPQKKIRILASDNWKNISSFIPLMPDAELFLLDRAESRIIGLSGIWKNRMRFVHLRNFVTRSGHRAAHQAADGFVAAWTRTKTLPSPFPTIEFKGHDLTEALIDALDVLIDRGGKRATNLIEGAYATYAALEPQVVLVRASFSTQIHFPILCYVARACGIPSLEVQHGLIFLGSRGPEQSAVEYMATYGQQTNAEFKTVGYTDEKLFGIGSPRFDAYPVMRQKTEVRPSDKPFTIAAVVPALLPESWSDSYEILDYLQGLADAAARIPNSLVVLKLRPDPHYLEFYQAAIAKAFGSVAHRIAHYEPIIDVLEEADVIVGIYSTTILEGLISGRPVIYNASLEYHRMLGKSLAEYVDAGALLLAESQESLAASLKQLALDPARGRELVQKADQFMSEHYSFNGQASEKLVNAIRGLARGQET